MLLSLTLTWVCNSKCLVPSHPTLTQSFTLYISFLIPLFFRSHLIQSPGISQADDRLNLKCHCYKRNLSFSTEIWCGVISRRWKVSLIWCGLSEHTEHHCYIYKALFFKTKIFLWNSNNTVKCNVHHIPCQHLYSPGTQSLKILM